MPEKNGDGDDPWPPMISSYQEVADYAAEKGIHVGLQNHPSTGDDMMRIRSETDRPNFDFIVDTGQWIGSYGAYQGDDTPDVDFYKAIELTMPHAMYLRTKFYEIESGVEKLLDYERIVPIIKKNNYNGCISIVYEGKAEDRIRPGAQGGEVPARVAEGLTLVKSCQNGWRRWSTIHPSPASFRC